jgi:hypothetical protein
MGDQKEYESRSREAAAEAIKRGHGDIANLRELLIWTTSKTTAKTVEAYFARHHSDRELLRNLFAIALEGEDAGDAPWAAANVLAEFPASMLRDHKNELLTLSKFEWNYLKTPALKALSKLAE